MQLWNKWDIVQGEEIGVNIEAIDFTIFFYAI